MNFNRHSNLEGRHALLGASKWQWLNDNNSDELLKRMRSAYSQEIGTVLHEVAKKRITYGFKLSKNEKKSVMLELLDGGIPRSVVSSLDFDSMYDNLMAYVNDCIGYRMKPEVVLYYSDYCFGTADAITFIDKDKVLRIFDYKSGSVPAHIEQLLIYASLFCLEYHLKPYELNEIDCRIYQSCQVLGHNPEADEIVPIMDKIISFDKFMRNA